VVHLLDARAAGLDEPRLRAWARAQGGSADACFVARSYRHPYALIARHVHPVGIDIERIEPCDAAFAESICTPWERAELPGDRDRDAYLTSLWCSKEALAKALGDALRYDPRRLESPISWPPHGCGPWRAAPLAVPPQHVGWICWRERQ